MSIDQAPSRERGPAALVQSVDPDLAVLEILARRGETGVTGIAAELGGHESTASRLVAVLEGRALVEQLADRGEHRLGFGVLAGLLEPSTDTTVTDPDALERQLTEIELRGWVATVEELQIGLDAVAAPVRDPDGQVTAAGSVSGPSFRLSAESLEELGPRVVAAADELSRRLGPVG